MLRILSSSQLEGYVIKGRGGPPWELLAGTVAKIQQDGEALLVCISGSNIENGMIKTRTAKVVFVDDYGEYRKMLKTRVVASKIQIGSYISVLCKIKAQERIAADFKYSGLWNFSGYKGKMSVIIGNTPFLRTADDGALIAEFLDKDRAHEVLYSRIVQFSGEEIKKAASLYMTGQSRSVCICGPRIRNIKEKTDEKGFKSRDISYYECRAFETLPF